MLLLDACPILQRPHYSVTEACQNRARDRVLYNSRCQCINVAITLQSEVNRERSALLCVAMCAILRADDCCLLF